VARAKGIEVYSYFTKRAHGRHKPGVMNKLEAAYELHLEGEKQAGRVLWYSFEAVTFKLAADCRLTPDFLVLMADGSIECHEVKGFMREDALIKLKVAAREFPITFRLVKQVPAREGGGWDIKEIIP